MKLVLQKAITIQNHNQEAQGDILLYQLYNKRSIDL